MRKAMSNTYSQALDKAVSESGLARWRNLPFFKSDKAAEVCTRIDSRVASGAQVLPAPDNIFTALNLTPLDKVRVVILGQDPYPTPGDAHGLAFSYVGNNRLPASLRNIFKELASDTRSSARTNGNLSGWAQQGVLLLNTALTVEAGAAGAHLKYGWSDLADQAISAVSAHSSGAVFVLWGSAAHIRRARVDENRHLVIASAHPSPLSAHRGFFGSKPFSRANAWLVGKGLPIIDWNGEYNWNGECEPNLRAESILTLSPQAAHQR
jgi:uracil-DNA glycosylase